MTIEELVPLTNGLSVTACGHTLVCDRARVAQIRGNGVDLKFWIVGTDFVPRLRLSPERIAKATADEVTKIVRRVIKRAVCRG